nr:efflux RND transporter periplasmic adaptor subunit [Hyphomonas sp. Mor2]
MKRTYFIGALLGAMALNACSGPTPEVEETIKERPAKLTVATQATMQRNLTFPAVIRAVESADLTFQIAGEIQELNVLEGQIVERGDVIARLDSRNNQNQVAQAQAEYNNAVAEFERAERLAEQDAISRSVLETRRTTRDIAAAALDNARKSLSDTVLRAPFDGSISLVSARRFQNVQAKESIATIQTQEVEAVVNMPSTIIARIPQLIPVGVNVRLDGAPNTPIQAEFREAAGTADPETQTYEVSFSFSPPEGLLTLPGMTATVDTELDFSGATDIFEQGISVPLTAILAEGGETFVWVVDPDSYEISKQRVSLSTEGAETVTVVEGLQGGELVIAAGVTFFNEGMTVRPWQPR